MPKRKAATKKGITGWVIHLIIFAVGIFLMWFFTYHGKTGWVYPWPSWITAAWGLAVIAHACLVWSNYEDKSYDEFHRQTLN